MSPRHVRLAWAVIQAPTPPRLPYAVYPFDTGCAGNLLLEYYIYRPAGS